MPLTNPDKVVTEERLAEFYQQILPYLGGMPDIMANKFSKADLYSTDEKLIGRWIDGKPLYQITTDFGSDKSVSNSSWYTTEISNDGIERIVGAFGISSTGTYCPFLANCDQQTYVQLLSCRSGPVQTRYVTIQYTKTTDSPVVVGDANDYSTTEKIVGTWIDGKPIYQKTIDCGAMPNNTSKNVAHGISNLDKVINFWGMAYSNVANQPLPIVHDTTIGLQTVLNFTSTNIFIRTNSNQSGYSSSYVTLQYTKTS